MLVDELADQARRRQSRIEAMTLIGATGLLLAALALTAQPVFTPALAALVVLAALGAWTWQRATLRRLDAAWAARRLDALHPELEDSTELLLRPPPMPADALPARQFVRVSQRLERLAGQLRPSDLLQLERPAWLRAAPWVGLAAVAAALVIDARMLPHVSISATVVPAAYTGAEAYSVDGVDFTAPEGSTISWMFSGVPERGLIAWEVNGQGVDIATPAEPFDHVIVQDLVYRFRWRIGDHSDASPTGAITMVRDNPPQLLLTHPVTWPVIFREPPPEGLKLTLEARDDYAIASAALLLTVAKGEGEGVKFRERRLPLDLGTADGSGRYELTVTLDPATIEMTAGDEVYAQFEVFDNRPDAPGRSLTPTVIFRWIAPTLGSSGLEGLPVDRIPEYFRSQRQIIIDTERLIAERGTVAADEFKQRAQSLSMDQRSLRLRYGQYLGEEAESGGSPVPAEGMESGDGEDDHDDHGHGNEAPGSGDAAPGDMASILEEFGHSHDYSEQATLFDAGTRGTLKAALNAMWQSELGLGLYEPEVALPHEYEALRNLKAVQQAARIYVKRVGFEPPPLSEERRLTGELDGTSTVAVERTASNDIDLFEATLRALLAEGSNDAELPTLLEALRADVDFAASERALAARWLEDRQCANCREALLSSLLARATRALPTPGTRTRTGSRDAAIRYLQAIDARGPGR